MKHYIKLALSAIITCSIGYAENLKICQSEEDKIQGCLERIYLKYHHAYVYEFPYKKGRIEGIAKAYSDEKLLVGTYPYKNGKLDGIAKEYRKNGNLEQEVPYKNNVIDGVVKWYHESGDLITELTYKNETIISGKCGNGKAFSNAHLHNLEKHYNISRAIEEICKKP